MIRALKIRFYRWKLERLIAARLQGFDRQDYIKRRKAALKHQPREWAQ